MYNKNIIILDRLCQSVFLENDGIIIMFVIINVAVPIAVAFAIMITLFTFLFCSCLVHVSILTTRPCFVAFLMDIHREMIYIYIYIYIIILDKLC